MMKRMFWLTGALALVIAAMGFAFAGSASAQEPGPDTPLCAPDSEVCTLPSPCDPDTLCSTEPACPPDATVCFVDPIPCDIDPDVLCFDPGVCPDTPDVICVMPDCPDGEPCKPPFPCTERGCEIPDADSDGFWDDSEVEWGSDPNDANSTPEHGYLPETCEDGADNDGDGSVDMSDSGCRVDSDGDGWPDLTDNCPWDSNAIQADRDGDNVGDACDYDADNDNWDDETERMGGSNPNDANSTPEHTAFGTCEDGADNDADGSADSADPGCAPDQDYDFHPDASDNCPTMWNEDQADADGDGTGDACEDNDGDGFFDIDETNLGSDANDASSTPEYAWFEGACDDGTDNDRDGTTDDADEGCTEVYYDALPAAEDGAAYTPLSARDTYAKGAIKPSALPAAGSRSASTDRDAMLIVALASASFVAIAGSSLVLRSRKVTDR